jgi:hypothetical protein
VDSGSRQPAGCVDRRGLLCRKCRHRPETLEVGRSKQGAQTRQTISDSRLAPVIFRAHAIAKTAISIGFAGFASTAIAGYDGAWTVPESIEEAF